METPDNNAMRRCHTPNSQGAPRHPFSNAARGHEGSCHTPCRPISSRPRLHRAPSRPWQADATPRRGRSAHQEQTALRQEVPGRGHRQRAACWRRRPFRALPRPLSVPPPVGGLAGCASGAGGRGRGAGPIAHGHHRHVGAVHVRRHAERVHAWARSCAHLRRKGGLSSRIGSGQELSSNQSPQGGLVAPAVVTVGAWRPVSPRSRRGHAVGHPVRREAAHRRAHMAMGHGRDNGWVLQLLRRGLRFGTAQNVQILDIISLEYDVLVDLCAKRALCCVSGPSQQRLDPPRYACQKTSGKRVMQPH